MKGVLALAAAVLLGLAGVQADQCPGSQQKCATGMTCCELPSGQQGCCPYANATCCPDKVHCCPLGSACSTKGGGHCHSTREFETVQHAKTKLSDPEALPEVANSSQIVSPVNDVCGDGTSCPDRSTCCPLNEGRFGCCPMASAVCCADRRHCCPEGSTCDDSGYCHQNNFVERVRGKKVKKVKKPAVIGVKDVCPGGSGTECPEGSTCCAAGQGSWGCCPMDHAACCPDQKTCCPEGYQCSSAQGQPGCIKQH